MFGQARGRQGAYDESKMEMEMTMVTQMEYGAGGQVHVHWRARRFHPGTEVFNTNAKLLRYSLEHTKTARKRIRIA